MKCIIDTNVPLKASNLINENNLETECARACFKFIKEIMDSPTSIIVLDSNNEIFSEYRKNLCTCGQNTVATQFFNWICRNLTLRENGQIEWAKLTVIGDREYAEFPASESLNGFDISDRKFIALSNAHPEHPPIVEGTDSLWWGYKDALERLGIHIQFLYKDYVRVKYEETHNT